MLGTLTAIAVLIFGSTLSGGDPASSINASNSSVESYEQTVHRIVSDAADETGCTKYPPQV